MANRGEGTVAVLETNESESRPGVFYEIRIGDDMRVYCSCPGWVHHQDQGCKHLKAYLKSHPNLLKDMGLHR